MTETTGLFRQITNAILDLQTASLQSYPTPIKKLGRLLNSVELQPFNAKLIANMDLDAILENDQNSRSSFSGTSQLEWPESETETLGLQFLLIQKFSEEPKYMCDFAHEYYYADSRKYIRCIQNLTSQLIIPFVRDYTAYIKNNGTTDSVLNLPISKKVFIVHGHDGEARETVARFLSIIGLDPIILHEQANKGRTVIEKVEHNSDVGFAVVLLTPDDQGRSKTEDCLEDRVRQNVLLELGYFIGKLGRERVCALRRGKVSIPSDFAGVVWEEMDISGAWKLALARELRAAGHEVDLDKIIN